VTQLVTVRLRELFTHALHSDRVIIFLKGWKTKAYLCSRERSRRWWCIGRCPLCSSFRLFSLWLFFSSALFSLFVFFSPSPSLFLSLFLFVCNSLSTGFFFRSSSLFFFLPPLSFCFVPLCSFVPLLVLPWFAGLCSLFFSSFLSYR